MIMVKYNAFAAKDHPFNTALDAAHAKGIGLISMKQLAGSETMLKDMATKVPSLKDKGPRPLPDAPARDLDRRADLLLLRLDEDF